MSPISFEERTLTRSHGVLSSRLGHILRQMQSRSHHLDPDEREILAQGEELLTRFVTGSRLVEGKSIRGQLGPEPDTVRDAQHALLTLKRLEWLSAATSPSKALQGLRKDLVLLQQQKGTTRVEQSHLVQLESFFTALADILCDNLTRQRMQEAAPITRTSKASLGRYT